MRRADAAELLLLAAVWGSSFLFMRLGAVEFGPVTLAALRVGLAAAVLLPIVAWRGELGALRRHWRAISLVGIANSGLPFLCFGYAVMHMPTGLASIFNATAPLWGALIAWLWLGERPAGWRVLGLAVGFAGVIGLAGRKALDGQALPLAIAACLFATLLYGWAANCTKKHLQGVPAMALAGGSQIASLALLALPGALWWPATLPSAGAFAAVAGLAVLCTGLAYVLYFRLIARVGPANAIAVTYLIPAFAVAWGALLLGERITTSMAVGAAVILLGTALATGLLPRRRPQPAAGSRDSQPHSGSWR